MQILLPLILSLAVSCQCSAQSVCSWMNPQFCTNVTTPVLGLYVVHMRKAGGSSILRILKNWLIRRGCVTPELAKAHNTFLLHEYTNGVPRLIGNPPFTKLFPQLCPYVDIIHNEYQCTIGASMLPYPLSRRPDLTNGVTRYAALTTLRDPIERIGSQAFYKQGVGLNILQQEAKRLCGKMSVFYSCKTQPERDGCDCYRNVMNSTKAILKNNETLWFQWINQSTPGNFMGDFYSSNYYIKRIGRSKLSKMHRTVAKCLRQVSACDKVKSSSAAIVKNFGHSALCGAEDVDVVEGLEVAKVLLRDHFEFILTERFVEKYTTDIISKVLHDPSFLLNHHHLNVSKENFGHVSAVASYTSFMPAAVLEFLHEDNKYDIMLYRYAVELYNERYGFPDS